MSELSGTAIILGSVIAMIYAPFVFVPDRARNWFSRFPRCRLAGRLLVAGDLACVAWLLYHAPLGRFEGLKSWLFILGPAAFFLVIYLMDELLAPRALGGLLLLVPAPLLTVARWHESGFRFVISMSAYALVVIGIILVLSPYQFRKAMDFLTKSGRACRTCGVFGLGFGIFIVLLGMKIF